MARWWAVLVLVGGCGHSAVAPPRFALLEPDRAAARLGGALADHRGEIVGCFDEMAERREVSGAIRVAVAVQIRGGALSVAEVKPLDAASITDGGLFACVADRLSRIAVGGPDADLEVPLAVAPRVSARVIAVSSRAAAPPSYVPQE